MNFKGIPVRTIGPGSQPAEGDGESLSYIDMPSDMATYRAPTIPQPESVAQHQAARHAMAWLQDALQSYDSASAPLLADLTGLDAKNRELINQILSEGEVSIAFAGSSRARCQEAVLAGVWRTLYLDAEDRPTLDLLEVGDVPHLLTTIDGKRNVDTDAANVPDGVVNALPILIELEDALARYRRDGTVHAINLSLLPLGDADLGFLDTRLGRGALDILSRAYGKCQVISTGTRDVWWVRYFNSMNTLILNTLEVTDVPAVVRAAPEDLGDSAERLNDLLEPYWPEVA